MRPPPLTLALPSGTCPPPAELFPLFAERHGAVFLDSALPSSSARYSILACEPTLVLRASAHESAEAFMARLRQELEARACASVPSLPFVGGAIGYLGYESGAELHRVATRAPGEFALPSSAFAFYDSALIHDHTTGLTTLVAPDPAALQNLHALFTTSTPSSPLLAHRSQLLAPRSPLLAPAPDLTPAAYAAALARIRAYIATGDTYQVNFTQRFTAPFSDSAAALYLRLRTLNPAPHAAYLDFGDHQIVSSTPERLLRVAGRALETRPIKGTIARLPDPADDAAQRARLLASAKDHAELLMIVDLARNDLGRVATPGTVHVAARHDLETYTTVHHLVATVRAQLAPGLDRFDALRALHPGGSITGAPKVRAMQIIAELEPTRRHVYTGALGYLGYDGDADLAIAIRTITCTHGRASYHVGGGITWDSDPDSEYQETLHKGRALHQALTSV